MRTRGLCEKRYHWVAQSDSAEQGIGKTKNAYLEMMFGKETIAQMVALKKSLDPACVLCPDNIFPKELLA